VEIASLSTKGQIVIPKKVRDRLGVRPGTRFRVEVEGDRILLVPLRETVGAALFGRFKGTDLLGDLRAEHQRELARDG